MMKLCQKASFLEYVAHVTEDEDIGQCSNETELLALLGARINEHWEELKSEFEQFTAAIDEAVEKQRKSLYN